MNLFYNSDKTFYDGAPNVEIAVSIMWTIHESGPML